MKNQNKLNLGFVLTIIFAVLFFAGEGWCQKKHSSDLSANKKGDPALTQSLNESLGQIHAAPLTSPLSSNFYVKNKIVPYMKEVHYEKDDSCKTHRDTISAFRQYYGVGLPHVMDSNGTFGDFMYLDDGSFWVIDPRDIISAMYWDPMAIIFVQQNNDPFSMGYHYVLINNNNDEAVRAMYIGGR